MISVCPFRAVTAIGAIQWKRPTIANLGSMVKNPAYAGAFVYGRTRSFRAENTGKMRQRLLPSNQWRIVVRDQYPPYISWETFETIQQMLRDNHAEYDRNKTRGVPRDGQALLHGIVYCGECGHKLCVQYKGGTQYLCNHLRQQHGEPVCQRLPASPIDEHVVQWFMERSRRPPSTCRRGRSPTPTRAARRCSRPDANSCNACVMRPAEPSGNISRSIRKTV